MAVTLTLRQAAERLGALKVDPDTGAFVDPVVYEMNADAIWPAASAWVVALAPDAPDAIHDMGALQIASYLMEIDRPVRALTVGSMSESYDRTHILRSSGVNAMLSPWIKRGARLGGCRRS